MNDTNNLGNDFSAEKIKLIAHSLTERFAKPIDTEHSYIELKKCLN